jgi:hypothetical protein
VAGMIFFTDNYQDRSTNDGYQFEFYCRRCGNGYSSSFQHSVTGFGGRLLRLGGDLVGGAVGKRAQQVGWDAEWMRAGSAGRPATRHWPGRWTCGQESGGGKFCQGCGHALAAAPSAQKFCSNCGTALAGARFCGECGTPAG